tara:strand:+ start:5694 stop:6203 length:510 start_codon:yes stop_codon:yes gene_type:complete
MASGSHFNIVPSWNIEDYKKLKYKLDTHKDNEDNQRYIDAGHNKDSLTLYNYFEPNKMPTSIIYIKSQFPSLKNISVAINLFKPGQYMPIHYDRFTAYKKHHNIPKGSDICRHMVMLEDHEEGQMLQIGKQINTGWEAGSVYKWNNSDIHTFYNLSTKDRYAVQVTGTY